MKVFLSWSGDKSKETAELLDSWIRCVLQAVDPWISTKHIGRGALWFTEVADQLQHTTIGIICLTKENLNKPWILFEAGSLARGLTSSRVCTFLVDLQPTDIEPPLSQFNHTLPNKDNMRALIDTLNESLKENKLRDDILETVFETYWPKFETEFGAILKRYSNETLQPVIRTEENILLELLETTRTFDKRIRNIESSVKNQSTNLRNILSSNQAKRRIFEMVREGIPKEIIIENLADKGISPNFTIKEINEISREMGIDIINDNLNNLA
ncbi:toll/interleukin-1 receptor domain-containing protein [Acinetobacter sp. Ac_5812]|uniref:toll/interleukin-1 receptor domain-containing protein n=1 Tax=Acinetobacter sp. Ac_5812 TaxID=1848937 RepID=UPI001490718B|nr:toll/interleukin-1 receptor domain-containing protein [Acinetobacter sp. Ac_5812]NNP67274.1 toll-Interleukin receptor [Acinetobacter sp. Ac_5812]